MVIFRDFINGLKSTNMSSSQFRRTFKNQDVSYAKERLNGIVAFTLKVTFDKEQLCLHERRNKGSLYRNSQRTISASDHKMYGFRKL